MQGAPVSAARVSALDPHHPLVRSLLRVIQRIRKAPVVRGSAAALQERLWWAGEILSPVCAHIAKARPSVEYDEAGQCLFAIDGDTIGRLKRPPTPYDELHPMLERAIGRHLVGDDAAEGDHDEARECAEKMTPATVPASRGTSRWADRKCAAANDREEAVMPC